VSGPKLVFVSNLFPDSTEPGLGLYNARIVRQLAARGEVRVIAPRPSWRMQPPARTARTEDAAVQPSFPRAWYVPRVGSHVNHLLMAEALRTPLGALRRSFPYQAILASWIYPDACAVARIAPELGVPFVAVAQGSDVHQYLEVPARRRIILDHMARAAAIVTRSEELRRLLVGAGLDGRRIQVIYNGVDHDVFHPARGAADRAAARAALGWDAAAEVVLYVGNLVPVKNPRLCLDAFARVASERGRARMVMVGDGPLEAELRGAAHARVSLVGRKGEREVAALMRAADVLCVPSDNEGVPNVILEGLASGLPVVATRVGGIPEIVTSPLLGTLVPRGDVGALAAALTAALATPARSAEIAAHGARYAWPATVDAYLTVLTRAIGKAH
jgi:glycosyltransferase involved in cell wall biosynthesis